MSSGASGETSDYDERDVQAQPDQTLLAPRSWSKEELIFSGDAFFDRLFAEVANAKVSVEAETFIFESDVIGARAEAALQAAAKAGAQVRLLVDGVGSRSWIAKHPPKPFLDRPLDLTAPASPSEETSVHLRFYHPLWFFARWQFINGRRPKNRWSGFWRIVNRRNHRKTWIIDGKAAFVGSVNISADHSERARGTLSWRDAAVRFEGEEIRLLQAAFDHAWARSKSPDGRSFWKERFKVEAPKRESLVRLNFTARLRRRSSRDFLTRLKNGRKRVWIANPYLVPSPLVLRALKKAKRAGADVKVLAPNRSDIFFMRWVASAFYGPLLRAGAEIYEYQPRFLHQKSTIIDDWATVGTSNLNTRSLLHDLEVDIVLTHEKSVRELAAVYEKMRLESVRVDGRRTVSGRFYDFLGRTIALLFSNWI